MTPADLLWLFLMLSALQPMLKQRLLEASRAGVSTGSSANAGHESFFWFTVRRS